MKPLLIVICLLVSVISGGQTGKLPVIPDSLRLDGTEDYRKVQPEVEKCLRWLCTAPYGQDIIFRSEANAFVLLWLSGTPDYRVDVQTRYVAGNTYEEELLFSLIHAKAFLMMTKGAKWDERKLNLESLKIVCELIDSSEAFRKEKTLRPLMKAYRKEKLEEYMTETDASSRR